MSRLSQAARNGALAAIGLYLISTSTVLVLSYATLQRSVPAFEQPGPLHSLTSQLPTLLRAIALG
ncbi:Uncharacterised protein [Ectopseudomonas mendocina]|jgi:hypothetical protein|uniref:Uncharacterized protein n=1 Tax=Ectopseudomonas mendocina S5.2 TaxID=1225174 RepID=A0ABM5VXG2_ECTME|nr:MULTISPECIES: hypothetical protein [Pseudomonas]AEB58152.1 hypothetical protein MDS_2121 [Pseudomonas mendocina NK-01]ALN19572.1 hypothetical protein DW68_013310 [Pseudomonas mendocina S5.2]KER99548.1 hypothetical protein HN51_06825 [Pseudomonas mendocina]QTN45375.1 hypothetical protein H7683_20730 [Pseudomonas mendocina]TRO40227.1 hypothetical protein EQ832_09185 [Pseudomonas sp. ALS1131]